MTRLRSLALVAASLLIATTLLLRLMGRRWWCACERPFLMTMEAWSSHTSQHLIDPYSVTHVLHGFVFWWLVRWLFPRLASARQVVLAVGIEAAWEILENTPWVIARYRNATAALGYEGDSIANALADVVFAWLGIVLTRRLGLRWSVVVFVITELLLLVWIRDNLTMNIVMLLYPGDALQEWQLGPRE